MLNGSSSLNNRDVLLNSLTRDITAQPAGQITGQPAPSQPSPAASFTLENGRVSAATMAGVLQRNATQDVVLKNGDFTFRFAQGAMREVPGKSTYDFNGSFEVQDGGAIADLAGDALALTIHYNYEGALPAEAEISIYVGERYAGQTLYYYYFNPETQALEYMQMVTVSADGVVTVRQSHCSDYALLTVNLHADDTPSAQGLSGAASSGQAGSVGSADSKPDVPWRTLPNAGQTFPWLSLLFGLIALASSVAFFREFKKQLSDEKA